MPRHREDTAATFKTFKMEPGQPLGNALVIVGWKVSAKSLLQSIHQVFQRLLNLLASPIAALAGELRQNRCAITRSLVMGIAIDLNTVAVE